jgi:iron-sulfur cluster assembly protein
MEIADLSTSTEGSQAGIKLIVDWKSILYLKGTTIDYSDGLMGKGFVFNNPLAKKTCGCGSSFGV